MLQQDPRNYQILFLSLFLILGIWTRDWTLRPDLILVAIATCLLAQWVAICNASKLKAIIPKFAGLKKCFPLTWNKNLLPMASEPANTIVVQWSARSSKLKLKAVMVALLSEAQLGELAELALSFSEQSCCLFSTLKIIDFIFDTLDIATH